MKKLILSLILATFCGISAFAQTSTWDGTAVSWTQGTGTLSNPYLIESAQNLAYLAEMVNGGVDQYTGKWFKLTVDINLNNLAWTPIGDNNTTSARFGGNFDGDNHSITNLKISSSTLQYVGLFGYVVNASGTFRNINIGGTISSTASGACGGGIVGFSYASKTFSNCHNSASVKASLYSGGLVGYADVAAAVTFTNCSNAGTIASPSGNANANGYSGGLIGYGSTVTMTSCNNSGSVSASSTKSEVSAMTLCSGGLIGYGNYTITMNNCSNSGNVTASLSNTSTGTNSSANSDCRSYSGGIVGYIRKATLTKCANTGNVLSTSATSGYGNYSYSLKTYSYSGGIVGYSNASSSSVQTTISLCYSTGTIASTANNAKASSSYNQVYSYSGGVLGDAYNKYIIFYNRKQLQQGQCHGDSK